MSILKHISSGGYYGDLELIGPRRNSRNTDTGLFIKLEAGEVAEFGDIKTRGVFNPLIIAGEGKVIIHSVDNQQFGGDGIQARTSGLHINYTNAEQVTPTRPYKTCERLGNESIEQCLTRNNETVFDPSILEWLKHPNYENEIIPGYHVDALIQLYATLDDGYTLNPYGLITDIRMPHIRARIEDPQVQLVMGSENNDYSDIHIGTETLDVDMPYIMPVVFNTLRDSKIGCDNAKLPKGSCIKIDEVKPRPTAISPDEIRTGNNQIKGFADECIIQQCTASHPHPKVTDMQTEPTTPEHDAATPLFDRAVFFDAVRHSLFGGTLQQGQVDGMNVILAYWEENHPDAPVEWVAYCLANTYHEVDKTMQPIKEYGGYGYYMRMYDITGERPHIARQLGNTVPGDGAQFCGQGFTACTGRTNYDKQGRKFGVDLVNDPGLIMRDMKLSAAIMVEAMLGGDFTGRSLQDCMKKGKFDPIAARRIINGYTKPKMINGILQKRPVAHKIKRHYQRFLKALNQANVLVVSDKTTQALPDKLKRAAKSCTIIGSGSALTGVSVAVPIATTLIDHLQNKASEVIASPVEAVSKLADASEHITEKAGQVIENTSGLAALFGLTQTGYSSFLFWALMISLGVIGVGVGLALYARWDDLDHRKTNDFQTEGK